MSLERNMHITSTRSLSSPHCIRLPVSSLQVLDLDQCLHRSPSQLLAEEAPSRIAGTQVS
jgi:hypothetical protein